MLGSLITAVINGLGQLLFGWLREKKADADEARADTNESWTAGDLLADRAEHEAEKAVENEKEPDSPLDWK